MQIPGTAWRLPTQSLRDAMDVSPELVSILSRYAVAFGAQVAETAFSNGLFSLEQRLARWLLMCHDRAIGDDIAITHEFLSVMLGVRRPAVTLGVQALEGTSVIRATRGHITIRNRVRLTEVAGEAYGAAASEYRRLLETA